MARGRYIPGKGLLARYQGTCPRCPREIMPGDKVVRHRHHYIHVECASGGNDE